MSKDICANNHKGHQLSLLAWKDNRSRAGAMRAAIVRLAEERGHEGLTGYEVTQVLGFRQATASARMSELKRDNVLFDSGKRRVTDTGNKAGVFVLRKYLDEKAIS